MKIDHFREPRAGGKFAVVLAVLGVLVAAALFGMSASAARAATGTRATVTYASHPATLSPLSNATQLPHGLQPNVAFLACQGMSDVLPSGPCTLAPPSDEGDQSGSLANVPNVSGLPKASASGSLGSNFNGISDLSQRTQTGFHFTPPDQGLCVGPAGPLEGAGVNLGVPGNTTVVVELVNDGWGVFSKDGTQLWLDSNIDLFSDPFSSGDIECNYDSQSRTYFFTEIGALTGLFYGTNLAVLNSQGYSAYFVDTAEGGFCFPDFPHQGADNNALYITINEFCGANEDFAGVNIYAISKQQLASHTDGSSVNGAFWTLGNDFYSFRAAAGDPTNTEYLLASEQNDFTQNALDFAWVTGDNKIASGGLPVLSLTSIPSESFTEPIFASSTGDDTTCVREFHTHAGHPDDQTWCSVPEATLDPTDMRLEQVQYSNGQLYTSLDTSMTVGSDPTVVDGAAWFQVNPNAKKVVNQGYVGVAGTNLLMPSMVKSNGNSLMMGFSATSPTLDPSSGYVVSNNGGKSWGSMTITGAGSGPHVSFSTFQPGYLRRRWGDYSRIAVDPSSGNVWMADEYIPSGAEGADTVDNWGTRVWELSK